MRPLYVLVAFALLLGAYVRVTHVDRKMFFQDEAFTALRVSGHSENIYRTTFFDGRVHTAGDIRALLVRDPSTSVASVVAALAAEDPHHAPLFYVFDRVGVDALGSSISDYRAISVLFGLLAIPAAFFLGLTASRSPVGGAVFAGLVAVSPLHVLYSQMAREYSLFACLILVSSAFAMRAIERQRPFDFIAYAMSVALGVYTDPLFFISVAAQAICAIIALRKNKTGLLRWLAAGAVGGLLFVPWALNAVTRRGNIETQLTWGKLAYPPLAVFQKWVFNTGAVFFDAEFAHIWLVPLALAAIAIAAIALLWLLRSPPSVARILGLTLTLTPIVFFVTLDAIEKSHFATIPRYLLAGWIGLEMVTAYALTAGIVAHRKAAFRAFAFLIVAGAGSALIDAQFPNWWTNNDQIAFQVVASDINDAPDPLLVSQAHWHVPLELANYLRPDVPLLLFATPGVPIIPAHRNTFVVTPTPDVAHAIEHRLARGDRLVNVSPSAPTRTAAFHKEIGSSAGSNVFDAMEPQNALWEIRRAKQPF